MSCSPRLSDCGSHIYLSGHLLIDRATAASVIGKRLSILLQCKMSLMPQCRPLDENRKSLKRAQTDANDPCVRCDLSAILRRPNERSPGAWSARASLVIVGVRTETDLPILLSDSCLAMNTFNQSGGVVSIRRESQQAVRCNSGQFCFVGRKATYLR
jgi:hypothetical protein